MNMPENKKFEQTVTVSKKTAEWLKNKLATEPKSESDCFGEDEKYSVTAKFDNGFEMDIEMCGVQYNEGEPNTPWTQAVLFNENGGECTFSEPSEDFIGEWCLEYDNMTFITNVVIEN
jgi:hypothetical protein